MRKLTKSAYTKNWANKPAHFVSFDIRDDVFVQEITSLDNVQSCEHSFTSNDMPWIFCNTLIDVSKTEDVQQCASIVHGLLQKFTESKVPGNQFNIQLIPYNMYAILVEGSKENPLQLNKWILGLKMDYKQWYMSRTHKEEDVKKFLTNMQHYLVKKDTSSSHACHHSLAHDEVAQKIPPYCKHVLNCHYPTHIVEHQCPEKHSFNICGHGVHSTALCKECGVFYCHELLLPLPKHVVKQGWILSARNRRGEYTRDLLLVPTFHCLNEQMAKTNQFWQTLSSVLNFMRQYCLKQGLQEDPIDSVYINFGLWETAQEANDEPCHAHAHIVLTLPGHATLKQYAPWSHVLKGRQHAATNHLDKDNTILKQEIMWNTLSSLQTSMDLILRHFNIKPDVINQ